MEPMKPMEPMKEMEPFWPKDLGKPSTAGSQDDLRYAYFADSHRLAVSRGGKVTIYDTADHQIGGVSQQQGVGGSLTFTSQYGTVSVSTLPIVSVDGVPSDAQGPRAAAAPVPHSERAETAQETDIFAKIERLADLQQKGILSPEEFATKKAELLSRL